MRGVEVCFEEGRHGEKEGEKVLRVANVLDWSRSGVERWCQSEWKEGKK